MNNNSTIWEERNSTEPMKNLQTNEKSVTDGITSDTKTDSTNRGLNDIGKISGIYKIVNKIDGKYYVGSSIDIRDRWNKHKLLLKKNKHHNIKLQNAYNKHGKDSFEFVIELRVPTEHLLEKEQVYLNECKLNRSTTYNLSFIAGRIEITDEVRRKMSFKASNRSEETRKNMSIGQRGKRWSEETRIKILGLRATNPRVISDSSRSLISLKVKDRLKDPLYKSKWTESLKGKQTGIKNHNTDLREYTFKHSSGEVFRGTRVDLYTNRPELLPLGVHRIVNKLSKTYKGWSVVQEYPNGNRPMIER